MTTDDTHPDFPIDWNDLYDRIGDEEIIVEFALSFVRNGEKLMQSLEQTVAAGDPEQIEMYAHALKGAASNIGAIQLAKAAWQLEKSASEQQTETAAALLGEIRPAYAALSSLLQQPDWVQRAKAAAVQPS